MTDKKGTPGKDQSKPGEKRPHATLDLKAIEVPGKTSAKTAIGKPTIESIQSGLYWSNVGMVRELTQRICQQVFQDEAPMVVATGGFASLFNRESLFDEVVPDLILTGLLEALRINGYLEGNEACKS